MEVQEFFARLEQSIARYDLLRHPFYEAWSRGDLTLKDLQQYALDYYHHVESFPRCLAQFARRLEKSELREAVLKNLRDEMGGDTRRSHADLWLDFVEGIGAGPFPVGYEPTSGVRDLILFFKQAGKEGTPEQVLAVFYSYESQVSRVCREKWRGSPISTEPPIIPVAISSSTPRQTCFTRGSGEFSWRSVSDRIQREWRRLSRLGKLQRAIFGRRSTVSKMRVLRGCRRFTNPRLASGSPAQLDRFAPQYDRGQAEEKGSQQRRGSSR